MWVDLTLGDTYLTTKSIVKAHTIDSLPPASRSVASVSVAMATYNGERYLREQLNSIARQIIPPLEIVITDDQSTDGTAEVARDFAAKAPFPVRFYPNPTRLRYADNFLRAAELCSGDLIAFCDQDDIWLEDKLSACLPHFSDKNILLVIHTAQTILGSQTQDYSYPHFEKDEVLKTGRSDPFANHPGFAMIIRRELMFISDKATRPQALYGHDHWVWFLAACAGNIATVSKVVSLYRQHGSNVYGAPQRRSIADKLGIGTEIPNYGEVSDSEMACSMVIARASSDAPEEWRESLKQSAAKLAFRSRLHRMRAQMYSEHTDFLSRAMIFVRILVLGGYFPDSSRTRLEPRGALKDLILGTFGILRRKA